MLEWLLALPALLRTFAVFAFVVVVNGRGVQLGLSALIGAALIGLWSGLDPGLAGLHLVEAALSPDTLLLSLLLAAILFLSSVMKATGRMERVVGAYRDLVRSPRAAVATLPAVIGVLPVPGGAVFSAPMVASIDERNEMDPVGRATANYWFRHMIEHVWPLYPAFILTAAVSGLSISSLAAANAYAPAVLLVLGLFLLLPRTFGRVREKRRLPFARAAAAFGRAFLPVVIVIACSVVFDALWPLLSKPLGTALPAHLQAALRRYLPAFIGVSLAILFLKVDNPGARLRDAFPLKPALLMIATVGGIRVFSSMLETVGIAASAGSELSSLGVPPIVVLAALPLIAALVTGVGFGWVGLALPLALALVPKDASSLQYLASVALAGAFGFAGMMLSPLHVCMVVSAEHFGVRAADMLRKIALPTAVFLAAAVAYYAILTSL